MGKWSQKVVPGHGGTLVTNFAIRACIRVFGSGLVFGMTLFTRQQGFSTLMVTKTPANTLSIMAVNTLCASLYVFGPKFWMCFISVIMTLITGLKT